MRRNILGILLLAAVPLSAQVIQWTRQFGTTGTDEALAVATTVNAIYVVGSAENGAFPGATDLGSGDAYVVKFNLEGTVVWSRQFGTSASDVARGVAADASGVYVVGSTAGNLQGTNLGSADVFVRKYDPDGNVLWTRQFGGDADDFGTSAAVDASGLYVAGYLTGPATALPGQTAAGNGDAFLRKYDFAGNEIWTRQFGTNDGEYAYGVAVHTSGVYVLGETGGALGTRVGGSDYYVRKYDANGTVVWTRQFGTDTSDGVGYGGAVAVNNSGVYATGVTSGVFPGQPKLGGLFDAFVAKFDLNGNAQWTRQIGTSDDDFGYGIGVSSQWVYASGGAGPGLYVWRLDLNGGDTGNLFRGTFATLSNGIATDGSGAYVVGNTGGTQLGQEGIGDSDGFLFKIPHPPEIGGISDAFTAQIGVAPTTWIALYGTNFATSVVDWNAPGSIQGNQLPTSLDGVSVSINGRAATIYFISPGQINVLAPLDDTVGNVQVTMTNRYGTSPPFQVRKADVLPAFYAPFLEGTRQMVTAVGLDGTYVGRVGVDPRVTRAARPGEIVLFFATGFGRTNPSVSTSQIFVGAPEIVTRPRITIGGREASFAGNGYLVAPGLFQFNVTIPDVSDGEHAIIAEIGTVRSSANVYLSVRR